VSHENVEIVRAAIEAFNRREWDAAFKDAAPGFEVDLSRAVGPVHGVFTLDQSQGLLRDFAESWESLRIEPHEFIDAGDHVVVPWTLEGRGRAGIEVVTRVTWVWTIRDRALQRVCVYQERDEAFEAAGVRRGG